MHHHQMLFNFSSDQRHFCQFTFPTNSPDGGTVFSNSVSVAGGEVSLFLRSIPDISSTSSSVVGIRLQSADVWIVRVAAVTGKRRIDIKAGTTKADTLRVPNGGRGTWSDLYPVDAACFTRDDIFLLEFI